MRRLNKNLTDRYGGSTIIFMVFFIVLFANTPGKADIVTDGSLGDQVDLTGPDYNIPADLGRIVESNLFHSFEEFNILSGESGTFLGPNNIENIVARITGQDPSVINGSLRSEIPGANLFLINPFGIMFGPDATLDINGSFYSSTADYLRFSDGRIFYAGLAHNSALSVVQPEAFGFLTVNPASILINNSSLQVPLGETISFVGGDINIRGTNNNLTFFAGKLQLLGVGAAGEVDLESPELLNSSNSRSGNISITNADLTIGDDRATGEVIIKGGRIELNNARISSVNPGDADPDAPGIEMESSSQIKLTNYSQLHCNANKAGKSGDIFVKSKNLRVERGSLIQSVSSVYGSCGSIFIDAVDSVVIDGSGAESDTIKGIFTNQTSSEGKKAGDISISTDRLAILNDGVITTSSLGKEDAGGITVDANHIIMDNGRICAYVKDGNSGGITIRTNTFTAVNYSSLNAETSGEGTASDISIQADKMMLKDNSIITSESYGNGDAGNIYIEAQTLLDVLDSVITTEAIRADGGNIFLIAKDMIRLINGQVTATVGGGTTTTGGNVELQSKDIVLNNSRVTANAFEGQGGNIDITADTYLADPDSVVDASSELGIDGTVDIQAPLNNLSSVMKPLSTEFLSAASLLMEPCEARVRGGDYGSFTIKGRDALPTEPGALQMSPPMDF